MPYTDHFKLADDYLVHMDLVIATIDDPFIKSRYVGFITVSAVTVFELAIKEIFIEFAKKKHPVLGSFTLAYFDRINGRIKRDVLRDDYVKKFGEKYVRRFVRKIEQKEKNILAVEGASVKQAYANVITWRNDFAHEGNLKVVATYEEVKKSYALGKHVIHCLAETMVR
jgi:hypothetical protein